jgi:hypothetical protein
MGRRLWGLFHEAKLTDVTVTANARLLTEYAAAVRALRLRETVERGQEAGVVSAAEATQWLGSV